MMALAVVLYLSSQRSSVLWIEVHPLERSGRLGQIQEVMMM